MKYFLKPFLKFKKTFVESSANAIFFVVFAQELYLRVMLVFEYLNNWSHRLIIQVECQFLNIKATISRHYGSVLFEMKMKFNLEPSLFW